MALHPGGLEECLLPVRPRSEYRRITDLAGFFGHEAEIFELLDIDSVLGKVHHRQIFRTLLEGFQLRGAYAGLADLTLFGGDHDAHVGPASPIDRRGGW